MAKVAKLVVTTFITRVVVDENTSLEEIAERITPKLLDKINNNEVAENIETILPDEECPYGSDDRDTKPFIKSAYPMQERRLLKYGFDHIDWYLFRQYYDKYDCIDIQEILFEDLVLPVFICDGADEYLLNAEDYSQECREAVVECLNPVELYSSHNYPLVAKVDDGSYYAIFDYVDSELKEHDLLTKTEN